MLYLKRDAVILCVALAAMLAACKGADAPPQAAGAPAAQGAPAPEADADADKAADAAEGPETGAAADDGQAAPAGEAPQPPQAAREAMERAGGDAQPLADGEYFALLCKKQLFDSPEGIYALAEMEEPVAFPDGYIRALQIGDELEGGWGTVARLDFSEQGWARGTVLSYLAEDDPMPYYLIQFDDGWRLFGWDGMPVKTRGDARLLLVPPQANVFDGMHFPDENTALGYAGAGYPSHPVDSVRDLFDDGGGDLTAEERESFYGDGIFADCLHSYTDLCEVCFTVKAGAVADVYCFYTP